MNFIRRHKRAVSPVIAVVLLIALTAAAVGVVWVLFQQLSSGSSAVVTIQTTSAEYTVSGGNIIYTWTGTVSTTGDGTITAATWGSALSNSSLSISLNEGNNLVTIMFTEAASSAQTGSDTLTLTVNVGGNNAFPTDTVSWSAA